MKTEPKLELHLFYSQHCGLCHEQIRMFKTWKPKIEIRLIDCDKAPAFEKAAGIEGTPTTILLRDMREVERWVGLTTPPVIQYGINKQLY